SSLRSRPHPALRATFSRFAGEGLIPNLTARVGKVALLPCTGEGLIPDLAARVGKEALLPFTGEGARRADEGARAQRSVPLIFAWEGQQQLASLAPSSGAARHLLPLRRRRADPEPCGESW